MVMVFIAMLTDQFIKDNGFMIKKMDKEILHILIKIGILVVGKMDKDLEKESINILTQMYIMVNGNMIKSMVLGFYRWLLEIVIRDSGMMV